jgi:dynein heavy chain 1
MYEKRISKTEERIIRILEERLSTARSADDMFHVFGVFSPLFFRPAIRNAVNSFRASLVHNVREDVKRLQDKFTLRYDDSKERATADLRDIPPVAGRIIWARQIEVQLTTLMKRMEDVLGAEGWENYQEGRQLREVCNELRGYLDIEALYKDWLNNQLKAESVLKFSKSSDFVLLIEDDHRGIKVLKVNFDPKQGK